MELDRSLAETSPTAVTACACEPTFTVFADRYGPAAELDGLRQSFTAASVSHAVSIDQRHGIVTLGPQGITLRVSSEADEYARIRIVESSRGLTGTMSCSPDGIVSWRPASARGRPTSTGPCTCCAELELRPTHIARSALG
jgi:hypothetical protein